MSILNLQQASSILQMDSGELIKLAKSRELRGLSVPVGYGRRVWKFNRSAVLEFAAKRGIEVEEDA